MKDRQRTKSGPLKLQHSNSEAMLKNWLLFAVWLAATAYVYINYFSEVDDWSKDWLINGFAVLFFPGNCLVLLLRALRLTLLWKKFGSSYLDLPTGHGTIGKDLQGTIRTSFNLTPTSDYLLTLECSETIITVHESDGASTKVHSRFKETLTINPKQHRSSQGLPVKFKIPQDSLSSDLKRPNSKVTWKLTLRAETSARDYEAHFTVPVYSPN